VSDDVSASAFLLYGLPSHVRGLFGTIASVDQDQDHDAWAAALVQALENGSELNLAPEELAVDPAEAQDWPTARKLPGEALRAALLKPGVTPGPQGLKIRAAYITGRTDLADLRLPYGLGFRFCAFEEPADWSRMTVASLLIVHCTAPSLTLLDVHVGGVLALRRTTLANEGGAALSLDRADIKGDAFLDPVTVTGEVRVLGASIGGLNLRGATLINEGGDALSLDGADIKGDAVLEWMTVMGVVRALDASIGGELNLLGATLTNAGGRALAFDSARLNVVRLEPRAVKGAIGLDSAQISVLITPEDKNDMKVLTDNELFAHGWRLGDVSGRIRHDRRAAADWLSHDSAAEFMPQPWHELANVYERNGQPADARWLRWKAAQGVTRASSGWSKLIRKIYGALTGHGYYPLIAAVWLILAIVASGVIVAANAAVFTPTAANKAAWKTPPPVGQAAPPITGATPCDELQDRSNCLRPFLYGFDNALPGTLATGQAAQWTANGAQGVDNWILWTLGALKIASWILVALLLAGVTGLLRKT
jgi:hypothetical protein